MEEIYLYALLSVFVVSLISLIGVFTLSLKETLLQKYIFLLVSLAIGALLGDALIHLIPESFEKLNASSAGLLVISGILLFFILEKWLHWHHLHGFESKKYEEIINEENMGGKIRPVGYMILISDSVHNFLDGVIIGASYLISIEIGIATTLAVMLHEIPQEIGDFGVLVHSGFRKARALLFNFLSALTAIVGVIVILLLHEATESIVPLLTPLIAGIFIYIALTDLIPELHKTKHVKDSVMQIVVISVGVLAMALLVFVEPAEEDPVLEFESKQQKSLEARGKTSHHPAIAVSGA